MRQVQSPSERRHRARVRAVVDIHCHILPGLDDGAPTMAASLELAATASATGTRVIAATPHIREDHPFDLTILPAEIAAVNDELERASIELRVVRGGELALSMVPALSDQTLRSLCLGDGDYLLVESPYTYATDLLEGDIFGLQVRGFRVVLAHPERSPSFISDPERLSRLVDRGVLCSVTSASLAGRFGRTIRAFCVEMLREGLVHDVASDAHDAESRTPDLGAGLRAVASDVPGALDQVPWFTDEAPSAILAGEEPGLPPQLGGGGWRRVLRRPRRRGSD